MTPSESRSMLLKLPDDWRPLVARALMGAWADGFGCGIARLPAKNPFASVPPPVPPPARKRK